MIKLVVSDMDGTLLSHKQSISDNNAAAIHQLEENGIQFAIASGRDYHGAFTPLHQCGIECEAILGNGAQYCDQDGNLLKECYLDHSTLKPIFNILHKDHIPFMIFTKDGFYTTYKDHYVRDQFIQRCMLRFNNTLEMYYNDGPYSNTPCMKLEYIEDIDRFINSNIEVIKVEAFHVEADGLSNARVQLNDVENISYLSSFMDNIEITNPLAQKGLILEEVCKLKGISKDEVAVMGDGMNDLSLFEHFKYSFAPSNAVEEIKALAYNVCDLDCYQDSFAKQVEMILKL